MDDRRDLSIGTCYNVVRVGSQHERWECLFGEEETFFSALCRTSVRFFGPTLREKFVLISGALFPPAKTVLAFFFDFHE